MFRGFRELEQDPFFAAHRSHMQQMDQMFKDPFAGFGPRMIEDRRGHGSDDRSRAVQPFPNDPFGFGMFDMFGNMRNMMSTMQGQLNTIGNDPNSHSFCQTSFMSYSNTGKGEPKVYQASTSTRRAPGGIKETKKMERDSTSGMEKMAVGHHINDRGHVIERARNRRTGNQDDNQEFINLDETQAEEFDREWTQKARQYTSGPSLDYARRGERTERRGGRPERRREPLAIEGSSKPRGGHGYRDRE